MTDGSGPIAGATVTAAPSARSAAAGDSTTTTDASGHYQFLTLPAGTYDVTASKFGYLPSTAAGVVVSDGGDTVQDFALAAAPERSSSTDVVKDGSGQGWPLYAKIVVSGPTGFPGATLFTDPVTGYYSITLVGGLHLRLRGHRRLRPGYAPGGGPLSLRRRPLATLRTASSPTGRLSAGAALHRAGIRARELSSDRPPSPRASTPASIPPGWTVNTVSGASWKVYTGGDPCGQFDGNRTGGSGPYAIVNSGCDSDFTTDDSFLVTPPMDLSGRTSAAIQWANDFIDLELRRRRRAST